MSIKSIKTGWTGISVLAGNPQPGSFESIQTVTVASTAATVEFTSIPSGYTHLQIRGIAKSTGTGSQDLQVGFNSNTSSYAFHSLYGTGGGGTASSTNATGQTYMKMAYNFVAASSLTNIFGAIIIDILDYANTNKTKVFRSLAGLDANGSGTMSFFSGFHSSTTSAITSILIKPEADNFAANTSFSLYGIR